MNRCVVRGAWCGGALIALAAPLVAQTSLSIYRDGRVVVRRTFPQALQQVTAADVQRVASTYLVEQQRTVGWFIPQNGGAS